MPDGIGAHVNKRKRGGGDENGGRGGAGGGGRGGRRGGRGGGRGGGRQQQPHREQTGGEEFVRPAAADDMEAEEEMIVESLGEVEVADGTLATTATNNKKQNKKGNKNKKQKTAHEEAPAAPAADATGT